MAPDRSAFAHSPRVRCPAFTWKCAFSLHKAHFPENPQSLRSRRTQAGPALEATGGGRALPAKSFPSSFPSKETAGPAGIRALDATDVYSAQALRPYHLLTPPHSSKSQSAKSQGRSWANSILMLVLKKKEAGGKKRKLFNTKQVSGALNSAAFF